MCISSPSIVYVFYVKFYMKFYVKIHVKSHVFYVNTGQK